MFAETNITTKLNLLYYLEFFGNDITVDKLLEFLNISKITLKKYVKEINEMAQEYEIIIKGNSIELKSDHRENSLLIAKRIIGESLNITLLLSILYKKYNLSELAERLFITKSTVIYKVEQLNEYFKNQELEIEIIYLDNESYEIVGEEWEIRHFFKILLLEIDYYDIYLQNKPIFKEIHEQLDNHFNEHYTQNEALTVDTYVFIGLRRASRGFYLFDSFEEVPKEVRIELEYLFEHLKKKTPFVSFLESKYLVKFDLLLLANIIPIEYLYEIMYLNGNFEIGDPLESSVGNIIKQYIDKYNIDMLKNDFDYYVKLLSIQILMYGPLNQILLEDYEIHYRALRRENEEKLDYLYKLVQESGIITYEVPSIYQEFIIYFLVVVSEVRKDYFHIHPSKKIKILLYSAKHNVYSEVLEYILKDRYSAYFSVVMDYKDVLHDTYNVDDYDVIISDIYLDSFKDKYLYFTKLPSTFFWKSFEDLIKGK
ncbi:helix-turn-helix domain-containing protein [Vagococcus zengguangii]|uniref:Uncharacterized protein n=1 Tax=Vagococcus zengguangii TaxID=2571750 RepID=A0A4D7CWY9_9ENTE|nr:helix-turn-helix domain-containing protein [Vagococcus zengguangii]QCI86887.1 hypothetical protein FA707_07865 [Vagococcus zengguangii]TLG80493.1 hypothetical protein FE258_05490 [Vagococcus zengguangii]